jgi:hypothetical protein
MIVNTTMEVSIFPHLKQKKLNEIAFCVKN